MDALEFLRERKRMCNLCKHCEGCPLERAGCGLGTSASDEEYEKIIATVEKWSKEHPRKTRQSVFLEQWPEAEIDTYGYLMVCPKRISADCRIRYGNCADRLCSDCRREFWMQEME
jgi:hypothetical protein